MTSTTTPASSFANTPTKLSNRYIQRLAGTARACFVCMRPSPVVLVSASAPEQDFFYVCSTHLDDRHFATIISPAPPAANSAKEALPEKVSKEDIEKVKKEYEERQKAKKDAKAASAKGKDKEASDSSKETEKDEEATKSKSTSPSPSPSPASPAPQPAGQSHRRFTLHRDFYAMRVNEHKKRQAAQAARQLNMPRVPQGLAGP